MGRSFLLILALQLFAMDGFSMLCVDVFVGSKPIAFYTFTDLAESPDVTIRDPDHVGSSRYALDIEPNPGLLALDTGDWDPKRFDRRPPAATDVIPLKSPLSVRESALQGLGHQTLQVPLVEIENIEPRPLSMFMDHDGAYYFHTPRYQLALLLQNTPFMFQIL